MVNGRAQPARLGAKRAKQRGPCGPGRRLGLSQPGASRLIEALASRGLVASVPKGRGPRASGKHGEHEAGGRSVSLRLTPAGEETARLILAARQRALDTLLAPLGERARRELDAALSAVLDRLTEAGAPVHQTCRLCDERACIAPAPCPVDLAGRREDGP